MFRGGHFPRGQPLPARGCGRLRCELPTRTAAKRPLWLPRYVRLRAERLGPHAMQVPIVADTDLEAVVATLEQQRPDVCVVDSVQVLYDNEDGSDGGGGRPRRPVPPAPPEPSGGPQLDWSDFDAQRAGWARERDRPLIGA